MNSTLVTTLTFAAVVTAVGGVYSLLSDLYLRNRTRVQKRVDDEFRRKQRKQVEQSLLFRNLARQDTTLGHDEATIGLRPRLENMISQAALELSVEALLGYSLLVALVMGGLLGFLRQNVIIGVVAGLIGFWMPIFYVQYKRKARLARMLEQLPDAFDLMSRVVRAGQTTSQAILTVAEEFPQPIGGEFSYCAEQQNLGLSPELSLHDLARRTGLLEIKIFVMALLVQQQTGGSLTELLEKLATIIRQRAGLRGDIKTLTAEGRLQALILLGLPVLLFFAMFFLNRDYIGELLEHPTLIMTTLAFEGVGALWIRKIVNFDV